MLRFDEASHTYWSGSTRLPSVTEILKPLYGDLRFVKEDLLEYKSQLGQAVHKAVELHVLDGLDYSTLCDPVESYFLQYLKFERETNFKPMMTEVRVSSVLGYAGTFDLTGILRAKNCLVDLKTTAALSPAVKLQTAAYQKAYNDSGLGVKAEKRFALRLTPEKFVLQPYENDSQDFSGFLGFLNVYRWLKANNKTIEGLHNV